MTRKKLLMLLGSVCLALMLAIPLDIMCRARARNGSTEDRRCGCPLWRLCWLGHPHRADSLFLAG